MIGVREYFVQFVQRTDLDGDIEVYGGFTCIRVGHSMIVDCIVMLCDNLWAMCPRNLLLPSSLSPCVSLHTKPLP